MQRGSAWQCPLAAGCCGGAVLVLTAWAWEQRYRRLIRAAAFCVAASAVTSAPLTVVFLPPPPPRPVPHVHHLPVRGVTARRFHVNSLSSAHVYVRLPFGQDWSTLPDIIVEECSQLVKANSIEVPLPCLRLRPPHRELPGVGYYHAIRPTAVRMRPVGWFVGRLPGRTEL